MKEGRPETPQELTVFIEQARDTKGSGGCNAEILTWIAQRTQLLPIVQRGVPCTVYQSAFDILVDIVSGIPEHHDCAYVVEAGTKINSSVWGQCFPVSLPLAETPAAASLVDAQVQL